MSHLSASERLKIEHCLRERKNFQEIAELLGKARSTIVREVQKHRVQSLKAGPFRIPNRCISRRECQLRHVCPKEKCHRQCSTCSLCNEFWVLRRFLTKPSVKGNFSKDEVEKDRSILYRLSTKTNQRRMGCRSIFTIHSMSADFNRRA